LSVEVAAWRDVLSKMAHELAQCSPEDRRRISSDLHRRYCYAIVDPMYPEAVTTSDQAAWDKATVTAS
jgi:hypothetical protein